jgi:hypothetical protein
MSEAIVKAENGQLEYAMSVEGVMAQVNAIQEMMKRAMRSGEHYGIIPGTSRKDKDGKELAKPSLLKPGAEKLSMMFRLSPTYTGQDCPVMYANGHLEYRLTCTMTNIRTGEVWGQGVGSCSTLETKYRFRKAEQTCPKCGKPAIIKGKKEYGGGWLCFKNKGGCGEKYKDGDTTIENQSMGRVEHDNPADYYNTVLKMAKKRAQVDAVLTCTAASDLFTQDLEDMAENGLIHDQGKPENAKSDPPATPTTASQPQAQAQQQPPAKQSPTPQPGQTEPPDDQADDTFKGKLFKAINGDLKELKRLTTFKDKSTGETVNGKGKWEWVSEGGAKAAYGRYRDEQKSSGSMFGNEQREPGQDD